MSENVSKAPPLFRWASGFILYIIATLLVLYFLPQTGSEQTLQLILLYLIFLSILGFFMLQTQLDFFSPVTLFSAYYLTIIPAAAHFMTYGFREGEYQTHYSQDPAALLTTSLMYLLAGYIFTLVGFYFFRIGRAPKPIQFDHASQVSDSILGPFILINLAIGLGNFVWNVFKISNGDLVSYMESISIRSYIDQSTPHTTLFYLNAYVAAFLHIYYLKRRQQSYATLSVSVLIGLLLVASTGRIYSTISFVLSVIAIMYYLDTRGRGNRYIYVSALVLVASIGLYAYRTFSSVSLNMGGRYTLEAFVASTQLLDWLRQVTIEKGNVPNLPVLMKIIDSWQSDIGYLYGKSLVSWIANVLPSSIRPEGYQPSMMIKDAGWFPLARGAHPPTGIGEMYANFGFFGPFLGMFLFGGFCALLYNLRILYNNFWMLAVYAQTVVGFVFLYPKGEFDNLSLLPVLIIWFAYLICRSATLLVRAAPPDQPQFQPRSI